MSSKFKVGNLVSTHGKARPVLGVVKILRRVGSGNYHALVVPVGGSFPRWVSTRNLHIARIQ